MFVAPGSAAWYGRRLTRDAAEAVARGWSIVLLDGLLLTVAGMLILSIDWSLRSLATFVGALFILQGLAAALTRGLDRSARRANVVTGVLSVAAGVAIIVWPAPGLTAVAIFLGSWLIVTGSLAIAGAFAARNVIPHWWMLLIIGLVEVPLGVLALADPGATLAALITVGGIWAVAVGVMNIVMSFELKRLPDRVEAMWPAAPAPANGGQGAVAKAEPGVAASAPADRDRSAHAAS
jgi:uncharacterized membrane protein HdeD (DUF308 family)